MEALLITLWTTDVPFLKCIKHIPYIYLLEVTRMLLQAVLAEYIMHYLKKRMPFKNSSIFPKGND